MVSIVSYSLSPPVPYDRALVGAFSVIMKTDCEADGSFYSTNLHTGEILSTQPSTK